MHRIKAYVIVKLCYPDMDIENRKKIAEQLSETDKTILNNLLLVLKDKKVVDVNKRNQYIKERNLILLEDEKYKRFPPITIDFIKNYKKYIFFGHGWSISKSFTINKESNICIVMLDSLTSCYDEIDTDFLKELYSSPSPLEYIYKVYEISKKTNNRFCMYSSKENTTIPEMLLTTYTKYNEFSGLVNIDNKEVKYIKNIILLSDLVKHLGNNFFLQVYTCRNQLDTFQYNNMDIFEESNDIRNYIDFNNINLSDNYTHLCKGTPFIL